MPCRMTTTSPPRSATICSRTLPAGANNLLVIEPTSLSAAAAGATSSVGDVGLADALFGPGLDGLLNGWLDGLLGLG